MVAQTITEPGTSHTTDTSYRPDCLAQLAQLTAEQVSPQQRLFTMLQLRDAIAEHQANIEHYPQILTLAEQCCDWTLVSYLGQQLLGTHKPQQLNALQPEQLALQVADAYLQSGLPEAAIDSLRSALFGYYQNPTLLACYRYAQQQQQWLDNQPYPPQACQGKELWLTPLQTHHLEAFRWIYSQYSSEESDNWQSQSIAKLCNTPVFESDEHWLQWLTQQQQQNNKHLFAVIHQQWGMIGCVSLEVYNGVGFFYYWLGEDFQGCGFGPQAVEILLKLGFNWLNMHCCYAKVYDYNQPSQKALSKLGFQTLPFQVASPYANEVFYYLGAESCLTSIKQELQQLIKDMGSDIELV